MAIYHLGLTSTVTTDNTPVWGLLAPSTQNTEVREIIIVNNAATTSTFGLGLAASAGTQTSGVAVTPAGASDTSTGHSTGAVAWSAAPTVPTVYFRRAALGGVIGDPLIFIFPEGLIIPASQELVLWNIKGGTGSASVTISVTVNE
jgi:hypothetical protein